MVRPEWLSARFFRDWSRSRSRTLRGRLRLRWGAETEKTKGQQRPESLELDLLVVVGERVSDQRLVQDLEYRADVLRVIGDAVHPASIGQAVHGAYRTAIQI